MVVAINVLHRADEQTMILPCVTIYYGGTCVCSASAGTDKFTLERILEIYQLVLVKTYISHKSKKLPYKVNKKLFIAYKFFQKFLLAKNMV